MSPATAATASADAQKESSSSDTTTAATAFNTNNLAAAAAAAVVTPYKAASAVDAQPDCSGSCSDEQTSSAKRSHCAATTSNAADATASGTAQHSPQSDADSEKQPPLQKRARTDGTTDTASSVASTCQSFAKMSVDRAQLQSVSGYKCHLPPITGYTEHLTAAAAAAVRRADAACSTVVSTATAATSTGDDGMNVQCAKSTCDASTCTAVVTAVDAGMQTDSDATSDNSSSSNTKADAGAVDAHANGNLTILMESTRAGHFTDSFRVKQAAALVQKWNTARHGDVAVKLAMLKFWCAIGHISEEFRQEQAELAWAAFTAQQEMH
jgi:hypothetical protein